MLIGGMKKMKEITKEIKIQKEDNEKEKILYMIEREIDQRKKIIKF